jgi:hypothetical protein
MPANLWEAVKVSWNKKQARAARPPDEEAGEPMTFSNTD